MADLGNGSVLLELRYPLPFDRVRAEEVEPAIRRLIEEARAARDKIAEEGQPRIWSTTLEALDRLTEPLDRAMAVVRHLESVATCPELRAAYNAVEPLTSEF